MRVVRITVPKGQKPTAPTAKKEAKKRIATSPPAETRAPKRVASSPIVETGPEPVSSATPHAHSATHTHSETHDHCDIPHTPFRNPDLNDQPLHWSPSMFRSPEINRHDWTWSDWDSPSREFEDVTYQTDDWPIRDPLAHLPPVLRAKIKAVLALKPDWSPPPPTSDSLTADTVRYEKADFMSSFSSNNSSPSKNPTRPKEPTRSQSPDSSWVNIDEDPWPPRLLEMRLDDWRFNPLKERTVFPEFSPLSSRSASSLDASIHSQQSEKVTQNPSAEIPSIPLPSVPLPSVPSPSAPSPSTPSPSAPSPSAPLPSIPSPSAPSPSAPSASKSDASIPSQSSGFSSWVDVDIQKWPSDYFGVLQQAEEKLQERKAQRADTGTRDHLLDHTQDSLGSDLSLSGLDSNSGASTPSQSVSAILRRLNSAPDSSSGASTPSQSVSAILRRLNSAPDPSSGPSTPSQSVSAILRQLNSAPDSNSGASTPSKSTGDILQHFRSFSRPPSPPAAVEQGPPTFIPEAFTAPVRLSTPPPPPPAPQHFYTMRQLPSATAMEPRKPAEEPPREAGFGWKSLACVAVGAAAVGAGLAYAWFSS